MEHDWATLYIGLYKYLIERSVKVRNMTVRELYRMVQASSS